MSHSAAAVGSPFARAASSAASAACWFMSMMPIAAAPSSTIMRARSAPRPEPPPTINTRRSFIAVSSLAAAWGRRAGGHDVEARDVRPSRQGEESHHHLGDVVWLNRNISRVHCGAGLGVEDVLVKLGLDAASDDLR